MQRISFFGQLKIYLGKCFRTFKNEKQWKSLLSAFIIMLLISLVTGDEMFVEYKPTNSGCFAVICGCIWIGLFNSIQSVCRERAIVKREYRTGLRLGAYIYAHFFYELALSAAEAVVVTAVVLVRNASHLPEEGLILFLAGDIYVSILLTIFAADMMALLVSCIVKNETTAMTVMPFVLIVQLVMAGTIFELQGASKAISAITVSRWGMASLMSVSATTEAVNQGLAYAALDDAAAEAGTLALCWARQLLFSVVFSLAATVALRGVEKDKR